MTEHTTLGRLTKAVDHWGPGAPTDLVTITRGDAMRLLPLLKNTQRPLSFTGLGLDPEDLGYDVDDEASELHGADGPLLQVIDYDGHDPDAIRAVAEWWDRVAVIAGKLGDELRDQALRICEACRGYGTVEVWNGDRDCRRCGGTGAAA